MVVWLFGVLELGFRGLRLELEPGSVDAPGWRLSFVWKSRISRIFRFGFSTVRRQY